MIMPKTAMGIDMIEAEPFTVLFFECICQNRLHVHSLIPGDANFVI